MYVRKSFCRFPDFSDPDFDRIRFHMGKSGWTPQPMTPIVFNELIKHEEEVFKLFF